MFRKIQTLGLLALTCVLMMSVSSTTNIPLADAKMEQNATLLAFKSMHAGLATKAEQTTLTPQEAKTYKKLDKKSRSGNKGMHEELPKGKPRPVISPGRRLYSWWCF